jgi:RND family efflux transporter MFP subunit
VTAPPRRRRALVAALLPGALAIAGALALAHRRRGRVEDEAKARASAIEAGPRVAVTRVRPSTSARARSLLGEARPWASVTLYAKISGYIRIIPVDKGDLVPRGALLAIVESPETDQQYEAARQTALNRRGEAARAKALWSQGLLSQQEQAAAETDAQVAEASLAQLAAQKSYEILRAPFAATVTARYVDPGALVQGATAAQTGALPVVSLSTLDRLRVTAWAPQRDAAFLRVGDPATLTIDERPGTRLAAKITRLAGELAPRTRDMLVEIEWDNARGEIVPGGFVRVGLSVPAPVLPEVPADALVLQGTETRVAIVDDEGRLHLRAAEVADTDGVSARLLSGATIGERVALHVGGDVPDGARVRPVEIAASSAVSTGVAPPAPSGSRSAAPSAIGGGP